MHQIDLPAGSSVRFTATARSGRGLHRWEILVLTDDGATRLAYGSRIGGWDLNQRIDIPPQDVDCRMEVMSRHETLHGWADDRISVEHDTPSLLQIGFCDLGRPGARHDDVLMDFAFTTIAARGAA